MRPISLKTMPPQDIERCKHGWNDSNAQAMCRYPLPPLTHPFLDPRSSKLNPPRPRERSDLRLARHRDTQRGCPCPSAAPSGRSCLKVPAVHTPPLLFLASLGFIHSFLTPRSRYLATPAQRYRIGRNVRRLTVRMYRGAINLCVQNY